MESVVTVFLRNNRSPTETFGDDNQSGQGIIPVGKRPARVRRGEFGHAQFCQVVILAFAVRRDKEDVRYKNRGHSELVSESTSWVVIVIIEGRRLESVVTVFLRNNRSPTETFGDDNQSGQGIIPVGKRPARERRGAFGNARFCLVVIPECSRRGAFGNLLLWLSLSKRGKIQ